MGLDMYLDRKTYLSTYTRPEGITIVVPGVDQDRVTEVTERIGYWRKANQIHAWFVQNVQDGEDDCGTYEVSTSQLRELRDLCQRVLNSSELVVGTVTTGYTLDANGERAITEPGQIITDPTLAAELLPSQSGFFFGGTEYDQFYYNDLKDTVEILTPLLDPDALGRSQWFTYNSSW